MDWHLVETGLCRVTGLCCPFVTLNADQLLTFDGTLGFLEELCLSFLFYSPPPFPWFFTCSFLCLKSFPFLHLLCPDLTDICLPYSRCGIPLPVLILPDSSRAIQLYLSGSFLREYHGRGGPCSEPMNLCQESTHNARSINIHSGYCRGLRSSLSAHWMVCRV